MIPEISVSQCLELISPSGRAQIVDLIVNFRSKYGPEWLAEFREEYPGLCYAVDLAANYTADEALAKLTKDYPKLPVWMVGNQVREFHGFLRKEIDKKR